MELKKVVVELSGVDSMSRPDLIYKDLRIDSDGIHLGKPFFGKETLLLEQGPHLRALLTKVASLAFIRGVEDTRASIRKDLGL